MYIGNLALALLSLAPDNGSGSEAQQYIFFCIDVDGTVGKKLSEPVTIYSPSLLFRTKSFAQPLIEHFLNGGDCPLSLPVSALKDASS